MDLYPEYPVHRQRDKWPSAVPDLGCSPRQSTSSAGSASILDLVRNASRRYSSRTSNILRRASRRAGKGMMSWNTTSTDEDRASSSQDSSLPACEDITVPDNHPLLGPRSLRSSIRFSSYPSRAGTLRSRRMGEVFNSCRNRLSMNSLRESIDHVLDREGTSGGCYFQLSSSDPPRLDVLQDLNPSTPRDDGFRTSLEEAMQIITARGNAAGYVNEPDLKSDSRISKTMPARGKIADFCRTTETLKGVAAESPGLPFRAGEPVVADPGANDTSAEKPTGEVQKVKLKANARIRKAPEPRKGILQFSGTETPERSPATARPVDDVGIKVNIFSSHRTTDTVKLIYPWFQETKGRVEACPSHEAALNTLESMRLSRPVHDLAFYDTVSRSYILQPECFLVDRDVVDDVARLNGVHLVSLSRRWQALKGVAGAEKLRPGEQLDMGGATVRLNCDGEYTVVSIHRRGARDVPVFIEADDEDEWEMEEDGDAADAKAEP